MSGIPAHVGNGRLDILYANLILEALYSEHFRDPARPVNSAQYMLLDPRARTFFASRVGALGLDTGTADDG